METAKTSQLQIELRSTLIDCADPLSPKELGFLAAGEHKISLHSMPCIERKAASPPLIELTADPLPILDPRCAHCT